MFLSKALRQLLRSVGIDYSRFHPDQSQAARLQHLLKAYAVDLLLDVGANEGQFGSQVRDVGYRGRIVSFEPLADAYAQLAYTAQVDGAWQVFPYALGAHDETTTLHIAGNSQSSSLLDMLPTHSELASDSAYVGAQTAQVRTLDGIFETVRQDARNVYLKIDTQGYELEVLNGAEKSLGSISTIQLELSFVPLYQNAPLYQECIDYVVGRGYRLVLVEPAFTHPVTGEMLQVDATFHRDG